MTVVRRQAIRQLKRKVSLVVPAEPVTTGKDRLVLIPAQQLALRWDRLGSKVRVRRIGKQPLVVESCSVTAQDRIADQIGSEPHRPQWPSSVNWPSGSFRSTAVVRMTAPKGWRPAAIGKDCQTPADSTDPATIRWDQKVGV